MSWSDFDKYMPIVEKYMPDRGEGKSFVSQAVTAVNKLIYKWFNDGDVFDNTYAMEGWANDLSSYANWLYIHIPYTQEILDGIVDVETEDDYEWLLSDLADVILNEKWIKEWEDTPKATESIYDCKGPYKFIERSEWDEEEEY